MNIDVKNPERPSDANVAISSNVVIAHPAAESAMAGGRKVVELASSAARNVGSAARNVGSTVSNPDVLDDVSSKANDKVSSALEAVGRGINMATIQMREHGRSLILDQAVDLSALNKRLQKTEISENDSRGTRVRKHVTNAVKAYHRVTAEYGDKAGRVAAKVGYMATRILLAIGTLGLSELTKVGRTASEAVSLGAAFAARSVTSITAAVVFALPELVAVGAVGGALYALGAFAVLPALGHIAGISITSKELITAAIVAGVGLYVTKEVAQTALIAKLVKRVEHLEDTTVARDRKERISAQAAPKNATFSDVVIHNNAATEAATKAQRNELTHVDLEKELDDREDLRNGEQIAAFLNGELIEESTAETTTVQAAAKSSVGLINVIDQDFEDTVTVDETTSTVQTANVVDLDDGYDSCEEDKAVTDTVTTTAADTTIDVEEEQTASIFYRAAMYVPVVNTIVTRVFG